MEITPGLAYRPAVAVVRALFAALLWVGVGVGVAGCGTDAYPGEPPGTLHVHVPSEMKGFDPTQAGEETTTLLVLNLFDQLYEYDYLARPFALQPCLADGPPELSEEGLTYVIRMRRGIRYADDPCFVATGGQGREVTAHDVVFCLLRLLDARVEAKGSWVLEGKLVGLDAFHEASKSRPKHPARAAYTVEEGYPSVQGVVARDDHTVVLRLVEPYPQLVWVLAMPYASVYPPEAVAYYGKRFMHHPVSTGPYRVASYNPAQRAVLVRNPTYREERYPSRGEPGDEAVRGRLEDAGRLLPQNDRVVVTVFKETQPQWLYFQRGFLDRTPIPTDNFATAIDPVTQDLRPEVAATGVALDKDPRLDVIYDMFNMADPVVGVGDAARALRRAISLAIDREWAAEHHYNHRVTILESIVLSDFPEHDPAFRNPWKRGAGESRADALARARRILADAGIDPARVPPIRKDIQDDASSRKFFLAAQRDCADLGIRLEAYTSSWQEMLDRLDRGQTQMCGMAWGADYPDAQNYLMLFYGPNKPPGPNSANYQNPEYDRLYERAAVLPAGPERTELYRAMDRIIVDDCPWVIRYQRRQYTLRHGWLSGYRYHDVSPRYFKYCRIDDQARTRALAERNRIAPGPVIGLVLVVVGVLAAMVAVARRGRRGW